MDMEYIDLYLNNKMFLTDTVEYYMVEAAEVAENHIRQLCQ
jgi:hypothetical protein